MYTGDAVSVMFCTRKNDFGDGVKPSNVPCEPIECMGGGGGRIGEANRGGGVIGFGSVLQREGGQLAAEERINILRINIG